MVTATESSGGETTAAATTAEATTADATSLPTGSGPGSTSSDPGTTGGVISTSGVEPSTSAGTTDPGTTDQPGMTTSGTTGGTGPETSTTSDGTGDTSGTSGDTSGGDTTTTGDTSTSTGDDTTSGGSSTTGDPPEMCMQGDKKACYGGPPGTLDVGICKGGFQYCPNNMTFDPECSQQVLPAAEQCNGSDENCDGVAEPMLGPPIKIGQGKLPRLISHNGQLVAAWVDPFGKIILQRLAPDGAKVGAAVPVLTNAYMPDIEITSYAGGIGLGYVLYDEADNNTYVGYVRSFDANLAPLGAAQRLGLGITPGIQKMDLVLQGIGGGSSQYMVVERSQTNQWAHRTVAMPQGQPGNPVATTLWVNPGGDVGARLIRTDYGVVGVYPAGGNKHQMRAWGPAGNQVWDAPTKDFAGTIVANYNGEDIILVGSVASPSNFRHHRISATDGSTLENGGPTIGIYASETGGGRFDTIWLNNSHQSYVCIDYTLSHVRFDKKGVLVPWESKVGTYGSCGKANMGIQELRLAGVDGKLAMIYIEGMDIYFRAQLCQ